jgi:hypothetical protein
MKMTKWADTIEEHLEDRSEEHLEVKKICVDVGGFCFFTTHETLSQASYFNFLAPDQDYVFVDRDASTFPFILNFMRTGKLFLKTDDTAFLNWLRNDVTFYGLPEMNDIITKQCKETSHMTDLVAELKNIVSVLKNNHYTSSRENRSLRKSLAEYS